MKNSFCYFLFYILFICIFSFVINASQIINSNFNNITNISDSLKTIDIKKTTEINIYNENKIKLFQDLNNNKILQTKNSRMLSMLGCISMLSIACLLSNNRKKISIKIIFTGLITQFIFAFFALKVEAGRNFFNIANNIIMKILAFSDRGSSILFGDLSKSNSYFAFKILPTIIFFSALTAVLYHLRILEFIIRCIAFIMQKTLRTSGAESFSAAANIFIGQTEAPLLIRPFLKNMTDSEIMAIMTGGFATVAGGIMAAYVVTLSDYFPNIAGHLLAASVMAAPGSLVMAKIILPETNKPETLLSSNIVVKRDSNILDSAAKGTSDGLYLALNIGAMLIAFLSLITLLNLITSTTASWLGFDNLTLEKIFGYLFSPIAFVLGVAWEDSKIIGSLFATKIIINELVAYIKLSEYLGNGTIMSAKSIIVSTYALCGFANFTSIGIQIGGLSALAPNRRKDFARLGFKAMIAGSLACFQTAAIVGVLL